MNGRLDRGLDRWNARERGLELCACSRRVELRAAPGIEPCLRDRQRLPLVVRVALGDGELILQSPKHEVVARDLGGDGDLRIAHPLDCRTLVGARRLDVAANATEEVELPRCVETGVDVVVLAYISGNTGLAVLRREAMCSTS